SLPSRSCTSRTAALSARNSTSAARSKEHRVTQPSFSSMLLHLLMIPLFIPVPTPHSTAKQDDEIPHVPGSALQTLSWEWRVPVRQSPCPVILRKRPSPLPHPPRHA